MITPQIDRRWQNNRAPAGRFGEAGQKIIAGHNRSAMPDRPQKFFEIFAAHRPAMFLLAEHDGVVEIKNDAAICALK